MDEGHCIELTRCEALVDLVCPDWLAPLHGVGFRLLAAALGNVVPFVRKRAIAAVQHLFGHQIADAAFHDAEGGRGAQKHQTFGAEKLLEHRLDFGIQILEALAAVPDHRLRHGSKGVRADFDGSGDVKFDVGAHALGGRGKASVEGPPVCASPRNRCLYPISLLRPRVLTWNVRIHEKTSMVQPRDLTDSQVVK